MKNIMIFFVLVFLIGIQSCEDSNPVIPVDNNFVYPLKIGNKWKYAASAVYSNIRPDSLKNCLDNYSINLQVSVTRDTLLNSILTYEMKEESEDYPDCYAYYANKENGLIEYAYRKCGGLVLPKTNKIKRFLYKGSYFNHVTELIKKQEETIRLSKTMDDSLIYYEPPRMIYVYPLEIGKEWNIHSSLILGKINKEVVGKEKVKTKAGVFQCFKIQHKYDMDFDGAWDDDLIYYEFVSSKGLLKSEITLKDVAITSPENPEGVGYADVKEERVLADVNF
jgi:hypothetical protein